MVIHQCTRCELRFSTTSELADHLDHDHHVDPRALTGLTYPGAAKAEPLYRHAVESEGGGHTVLLVGNQSLDADTARQVMAAASRPPTAVYVLVPATPSGQLVRGWSGRVLADGSRAASVSDRADDVGLAQARFRLRSMLAAFAELGVAAHGSVGDPNPLDAVAGVVEREPVDEIVVSTLPSTLSRWLDVGVPEALSRRFDLPVRTMTAATDPA